MLGHGHGGYEVVKDIEGNDMGGHPPTILCKMNFYISSNKNAFILDIMGLTLQCFFSHEGLASRLG